MRDISLALRYLHQQDKTLAPWCPDEIDFRSLAFQGFREVFFGVFGPVFFLRRDESVHVCLFLIWSRHQDKFTVQYLVDLVFSRGALAHHDIQRDKMEFK